MAHTQKPWTSKYKLIRVFGDIDNNELAARLDSPNIFDRAGKTWYQDDFEDLPLKWQTSGIGAGWEAAIYADRAKRGSQSLKLTTGDSNWDPVTMTHTFPVPPSDTIGLEMSWRQNDDIKRYEWTIEYYDGTQQHEADIRWVTGTQNIRYYDSGGAYTTLDTIDDLYSSMSLWQTMKFSVNLEAEEYIRLLFNEHVYDMRGTSYFTNPAPVTPYLHVYLTVTNDSAGNHVTYVDDVIVTYDEPE